MKPSTAPRVVFNVVTSLVVVVLFAVCGVSVTHATPNPSSGSTAGGTAVTIEGIHFVQVVCGDSHSLGLTSEGTVYAWGLNLFGELGVGSTTSSATPVQVKGVGGVGFLTGVTAISAGQFHSLAVTPGGLVSWGYNAYGQLGDGTVVDRTTPVQVLGVGGTGLLTDVTEISGGQFHSLAVTPTGVVSWGLNNVGQLGDGTPVNKRYPIQVLGVGGTGYLTGVTSIDSGAFHSLAVTPGGVVSWGYNSSGELGDGTNVYRSTPVQVKDVGGSGVLLRVTAISASLYHSLALTPTGVVSWGNNSSGQLGDGTTLDRTSPVQVLGVGGTGFLTGVSSIAAGVYHSLAVTNTGVLSWGYNFIGQLGDGTTVNRTSPVQVLGVGGTGFLTGASTVSAAPYSSFVLTPSGVVAWGYNVTGQLGDGTTTAIRSTPVLGVNFQPVSVQFGSAPGTALSASGNNWNITSPAGAAGSVNLLATANIFAGTTAASPATVSWNAGTFSYQTPTPLSSPQASPSASTVPTLAATGAPLSSEAIGLFLLLILSGVAAAAWSRSRSKL